MKLREVLAKLSHHHPSASGVLDSYITDFTSHKLSQSETLQEAFEIDPDEMEGSYAAAHEHYMNDRFEESVEMFRWLTILNPLIEKYWLGFGASQQLLKTYEGALRAYAVCTFLDPKNPYPHFHAYECYVALEDLPQAHLALEQARNLSQHPAYRQLKQEIDQK